MVDVLVVCADGTYRTDGVEPKHFGDFARDVVNGWTEGSILPEYRVVFVVNELGKIEGLPYNSGATELYWWCGGDREEDLVGDVVIAGLPTSENVSSLSPGQIAELIERLRQAGAQQNR